MIPGPGWDPDAAAQGDGLYGLPHAVGEALVQVIPVPFEATVSYGAGTADAPEAILAASAQVDLSDPIAGEPWRAGIAMEPVHPELADWNARAGAAVQRCRDGAAEHALVDAIGAQVNAHVEARVAAVLAAGRIPAVLGGDHSTPVGALWAAARAVPGLGLLHIDAHADLRVAYEGFTWSHASAIHNMLAGGADIAAVISVGIRDMGAKERAAMQADPRITWWTDDALARRAHAGEPFSATVAEIVAGLPQDVWITVDIDGLDPALCPGTGTPVPGGLDWREVGALLAEVPASGRRIVGFDLVEVGASDWDANVGARLLYRLAGFAVASRTGAALSR